MDKSSHQTNKTRGQNKYLTIISYIAFVVLLMVAAEIMLRIKGIEPWRKRDVSVQVSPRNQFFLKHPSLGYSHIPGEHVVTLRDGYEFKVTHLPNTLRITHPLETYKNERPKREMWIFGGSITHGWSLNDQETYPWLLQKRFPEYEVVNFGVSSYGTLHSLIQLREAISQQVAPSVVVVAYGSFHDERNTFLRNQRKAIVPWNKLGSLTQLPYVRLSRKGQLAYSFAEATYDEFPLMRYSSLVHFLEIIYNMCESSLRRSHEVSKALIAEFANLALKHKFELVVAGIYDDQRTQEMLAFAETLGAKVVDVSVDLKKHENTNLPHDSHPSALANRKYAEILGDFLKKPLGASA